MTNWECQNGHRYTEENTYIHTEGWRRCRTCDRDRQAVRRAAAREQDKTSKRVVSTVPVTIARRPPQGDEWRQYALCAQADPEAFFPDKGGSTASAKRICAACEVRHQCLNYALENDERIGIYGGLSPEERKTLRKQTA